MGSPLSAIKEEEKVEIFGRKKVRGNILYLVKRNNFSKKSWVLEDKVDVNCIAEYENSPRAFQTRIIEKKVQDIIAEDEKAYYIKWVDYIEKDWVDKEKLINCQNLISKYEESPRAIYVQKNEEATWKVEKVFNNQDEGFLIKWAECRELEVVPEENLIFCSKLIKSYQFCEKVGNDFCSTRKRKSKFQNEFRKRRKNM